MEKMFSLKKPTIFLIGLVLVANLLPFKSLAEENLAGPNIVAENYITRLLINKVPFHKEFHGLNFLIPHHDIYPPGRTANMVFSHIKNENLLKNKIVVDIGSNCLYLGIAAAKHGAKEAAGLVINEEAEICARENIVLNKIKVPVRIKKDYYDLVSSYKGRVDVLLIGPPWDSISKKAFEKIPDERKKISQAFYDVDNNFISEALSHVKILLSPKGKVFITCSKRALPRMEDWFLKNGYDYHIVKQQDLNKDGDISYLMELKEKSV